MVMVKQTKNPVKGGVNSRLQITLVIDFDGSQYNSSNDGVDEEKDEQNEERQEFHSFSYPDNKPSDIYLYFFVLIAY